MTKRRNPIDRTTQTKVSFFSSKLRWNFIPIRVWKVNEVSRCVIGYYFMRFLGSFLGNRIKRKKYTICWKCVYWMLTRIIMKCGKLYPSTSTLGEYNSRWFNEIRTVKFYDALEETFLFPNVDCLLLSIANRCILMSPHSTSFTNYYLICYVRLRDCTILDHLIAKKDSRESHKNDVTPSLLVFSFLKSCITSFSPLIPPSVFTNSTLFGFPLSLI